MSVRGTSKQIPDLPRHIMVPTLIPEKGGIVGELTNQNRQEMRIKHVPMKMIATNNSIKPITNKLGLAKRAQHKMSKKVTTSCETPTNVL